MRVIEGRTLHKGKQIYSSINEEQNILDVLFPTRHGDLGREIVEDRIRAACIAHDARFARIYLQLSSRHLNILTVLEHSAERALTSSMPQSRRHAIVPSIREIASIVFQRVAHS